MRKKRIRNPRIKKNQPAVTKEHKGAPAFILCADDHIRNLAPICRTDNFEEEIFKKLAFRNNLAEELDIPILNAGDLGEKSYFVKQEDKKDKQVGWTAKIYNQYVDYLQKVMMYFVPGNHDLPGHDINNVDRSVVGSLVRSGAIKTLHEMTAIFSFFNRKDIYAYGCAWDCEVPEVKNVDAINVLVIHKMIIEDKPLWPGQECEKGYEILKKYPDYDLIVSGDNHNTFIAEYDGRLLVNPGSMTRTTTKQFDFKPSFFLYYPESHSVEQIFYPITPPEECISLEHIEKQNKSKEKFEKYSEVVEKADLSDLKTFEENIEIALTDNSIDNQVEFLTRGLINNGRPTQEDLSNFTKQQTAKKSVMK